MARGRDIMQNLDSSYTVSPCDGNSGFVEEVKSSMSGASLPNLLAPVASLAYHAYSPDV